jgi:hypothetical protein
MFGTTPLILPENQELRAVSNGAKAEFKEEKIETLVGFTTDENWWVSRLMKTDRREWDEQRIRVCMYSHDAKEVMKIHLPHQEGEDCLAWHYERSGIFTIRSAYKLALEIEQANKRQEDSNTRPDGSRHMYMAIWSAKVPPKVRIFAWKLSQEGLATDCNRKR